MREIPVTEARIKMAELANLVQFGGERIALTRHGKPVAYVVSAKDLRTLTAPAGREETYPSREEHAPLVWANPNADTATFIRAALSRANLAVLADIARDFGVAAIEREWATLRETPAGQRIAPKMSRLVGKLREHHAGA